MNDSFASSQQENASSPAAGDGGFEYWALGLLFLPVVTVFGNVLVCLSVHTERNLHTVTNYYIVSLAIADIMVGILVMPLAVYVEVNNSVWSLGDALCDTWVAFDVLCCTASILNLAAISVDRYTAITQPIRYAKQKHSKRVYAILALTWTVSMAISSPIVLGINYTDRRRSLLPKQCIFYNSDFIIFSSMGSFYIPCIVMLLLYCRMFRTIRQRARLSVLRRSSSRPDDGSQRKNCTSATESEADAKARSDAGVGGNGESRCENRLLLARTRSASRRGVRSEGESAGDAGGEEGESSPGQTGGDRWKTADDPCPLCLLNKTHRHDNDGNESTGGAVELVPMRGSRRRGGRGGGGGVETPVKLLPSGECDELRDDLLSRNNSVDGQTSERRKALYYLRSARLSVTKLNCYLRHWPSQSRKDRSATRRERKATKTLAIVLAVFLLCWVPFFTINIINAVCIRYDLFQLTAICHIPPSLFSFFVWLGYVNSCINPVIYTIFNVEFRRCFKRLLLRPCVALRGR